MAGVNKIFQIAGGRGKGKTTFEKEEIIRRSKLPKTIIIDTNNSDVWHNMSSLNYPTGDPIIDITFEDLPGLLNGIYRIVTDDIPRAYLELSRHAWNTLIIFEDAFRYTDMSERMPQSLKKILLDTKQRNNNVVFSFHALIEIPRDWIRPSDYLTLFKTGDPEIPSKWKVKPDVVRAYEALQKSSDEHANVTLRIS